MWKISPKEQNQVRACRVGAYQNDSEMKSIASFIALEPAYLEKTNAAVFLAISESTLEKLVREGELPKPRSVSGKRVAWLVRELREWAEARPISSNLPPYNTGAKRMGQET